MRVFYIFLFDLVSRNIHNMLKKILLALGVVVTISALGMKIVKFSNEIADDVYFSCLVESSLWQISVINELLAG